MWSRSLNLYMIWSWIIVLFVRVENVSWLVECSLIFVKRSIFAIQVVASVKKQHSIYAWNILQLYHLYTQPSRSLEHRILQGASCNISFTRVCYVTKMCNSQFVVMSGYPRDVSDTHYNASFLMRPKMTSRPNNHPDTLLLLFDYPNWYS